MLSLQVPNPKAGMQPHLPLRTLRAYAAVTALQSHRWRATVGGRSHTRKHSAARKWDLQMCGTSALAAGRWAAKNTQVSGRAGTAQAQRRAHSQAKRRATSLASRPPAGARATPM